MIQTANALYLPKKPQRALSRLRALVSSVPASAFASLTRAAGYLEKKLAVATPASR